METTIASLSERIIYRRVNRKVYSCLPCRERKIKCDRQEPCSTCVRRDNQDHCIYRSYSTDKGKENAQDQRSGSIGTFSDQSIDKVYSMGQLSLQDSHIQNSDRSKSQSEFLGFRSNASTARSVSSGSREKEQENIAVLLEDLPPSQDAHALLYSYRTRVKCLAGNFIYLPAFKEMLQRIYKVKEDFDGLQKLHDLQTEDLALSFLLFALGKRYFPQRDCKDVNDPSTWFDPLNSPQATSEQAEHCWIRNGIDCLQRALLFGRPTIKIIQSCLLLVVYHSIGGSYGATSFEDFERLVPNDMKSGVSMDSSFEAEAPITFLRLGLSHAQSLQLHRISNDAYDVESEIGRRIWWALCFREWTLCTSDPSRIPAVRREDFTTCLPVNLNDDDLSNRLSERKSVSEAMPTEMTYVIQMCKFGLLIEEHNRIERVTPVDHLQESLQGFVGRYLAFINELPEIFETESSIRERMGFPCQALSLQKWLLQSAVFSKLMKIYRDTLWTDLNGRWLCVQAAQSILRIQQELRGAHDLVDGLWTNLSQSYSAAVVLCQHMIAPICNLDSGTIEPIEYHTFLELTNEACSALMQIQVQYPAAKRCFEILQSLQQFVRKVRLGNHQSPNQTHTGQERYIGFISDLFREKTASRDESLAWPALTANGIDLSWRSALAQQGCQYDFATQDAMSDLGSADMNNITRWLLQQEVLSNQRDG